MEKGHGTKGYGAFMMIAAGLALLGAGLYLLKAGVISQGLPRPLPYLLIGIGCGVFGHGAGDQLSRSAVKKYPDIQKQIEIESQDERNTAIAHRAKAKAYDLMLFVFGALMLTFALMEVDLAAVLLLVAAYLFVVGSNIYYLWKYGQEM